MFMLILSDRDMETINHVGGSYNWSSSLMCFLPGDIILDALDATQICAEFKLDTEGGHQMFPMLELGSSLHLKLMAFWSSVIAWLTDAV